MDMSWCTTFLEHGVYGAMYAYGAVLHVFVN